MSIGSLVGLVAGKLGNLLVQEAKLLYDVKDQVQSLQDELMMMNSFLKDMDEEGGDERITLTTIKQIRKIAYDAEDVIDDYILAVDVRADKTQNFFKRHVVLAGSSLPHTYEVASEIETIKTRISATMERWTKYVDQKGIIRADAGGGMRRGRWRRQIAYPHTNEEHVVGLEEDINKLVGVLTANIQVLSIVGMGGSGKTTLARKLYNHASLKKYFDCIAWASISEEWVAQQVLVELLRKASGETMGKVLQKLVIESQSGLL